MAAFISVLSLFGIVLGLISVIYPLRRLLIDSRRTAALILGLSTAIFAISATVDGADRRREQQQSLAAAPLPQKSTAQLIDEACSAAGAVPNCREALTKQMAAEAAHPKAPEPAPLSSGETCNTDYRKCSSNSDLMNHFADITRGMVSCQVAAKKLAKYGSPIFPFFSFSHFRPGADYVRSGIAILIEDDAQFQNGFGAMEHTSVSCRYDLNTQRVVDVSLDN
jgi:hypothetical protein